MNEDIEQRIAQKAHAIWESEGRPEGRSAEHWQQARDWIDRQEGTYRDEAQGESDVTTPADRLSGDGRPPN